MNREIKFRGKDRESWHYGDIDKKKLIYDKWRNDFEKYGVSTFRKV